MNRDELVAAARAAQANAYAPYSGFRVGAALLATDGRVFTGANVENAAFTPSICAERVAASQAVASGHRDIDAVAVVGPHTVTPCGVCRQFLFEFNPSMLVVSESEDGGRLERELQQYLPEGFGPADLAREGPPA